MRLKIRKFDKIAYVYFLESVWGPVDKKSKNKIVKNFGRLDKLLASVPDGLKKLQKQIDDLKAKARMIEKAKIKHEIGNASKVFQDVDTSVEFAQKMFI